MSVNGSVVVRRDTHGTIRKHCVCLYARASFQYEEMNLALPNIVAVHLLDWSLWILAVYRPPSYGRSENTALIEAILGFCEGREVVILGDFNLLSLVWYSDADRGMSEGQAFLELLCICWIDTVGDGGYFCLIW